MKNCASSWLFTRIIPGCRSTKHKIMWQHLRTLCHSYLAYSYMHYINQRIHPLKYNEIQTTKYNYDKSWFVFCRSLLSALCGWRSASHDSSFTIFVALQVKSGLVRLIFNVSSSYTIRHKHTRPVGLLCTNNQLIAGAPTCTIHNKRNRSASRHQRVSNPRSREQSGFRPTSQTARSTCSTQFIFM